MANDEPQSPTPKKENAQRRGRPRPRGAREERADPLGQDEGDVTEPRAAVAMAEPPAEPPPPIALPAGVHELEPAPAQDEDDGRLDLAELKEMVRIG
jgi:hypothetical protein